MWQLWRNFDDFSEKHALVFSNFTRLSPPRRRIFAGVIFFVIHAKGGQPKADHPLGEIYTIVFDLQSE